MPISRENCRPFARVALTAGSAVFFVALIVTVFWWQDLRYSLPTPTPANFHPPSLNAVLPLPAALQISKTDARPVVLHFFNQDCPCSRFNVDQARSLVQRFKDQVRFVLVLQTDETDPAQQGQSLESARQKFGGVEGVLDPEGKIAGQCGVYSTPQAVILRPDGTLAYRGNYNVSRYCTDAATEFARLALEAVLAGGPAPSLPALAYTAYGCELPATTTTAAAR